MTWREMAAEQLKAHEGLRYAPYVDTKGLVTIGIGRCLAKKPLKPAEVQFLFEGDLHDAEDDARALLGEACFEGLSDARKVVMVDMAFNLGYVKLRKFVKMLAAVKQGRFTDAASEMLNSVWATEVGKRAEKLATQMKRG